MNAPHRRNACPGLSAPMATGDGLLVRLLTSGPMRLDAFAGICAAARAHGNGIIEITARGSLQVRGLTPRSAPLLASAIGALDLAAIEGVPVIADPLDDGPDALLDAAALASELRRAIADSRLLLAPKVSVVVDGGGRLHLDALAADVRLRAIGSAGAPRLLLALDGDGTTAVRLGTIAPDHAVEVVLRLLGAIAAHGRQARAADIVRLDGLAAIRSTIERHLDVVPELPPRPPAEPIGRHLLRSRALALGIAPAFGQAHADALQELAEIAAAIGVPIVRPAPGRALLLIGIAEDHAARLTAAAERLGFITRADDPRRRIAACPGSPTCAAGLIAARALAAEIACELPLWPAATTIHVSGCAKGCAHPAPAKLTVVGTERGCGIVRSGSARATPSYYVDPDNIVAEVLRVAGRAREAAHG